VKPLVYLAGPFRHPDPIANTHAAIQLADELLADGYVIPLVPHLNLAWHLVTPHDDQTWLDYDLHLLARCDALYRFGGASEGADAEVAWAHEHQTRVFDDLTRLYRWARP
jgi:hypothetical protein